VGFPTSFSSNQTELIGMLPARRDRAGVPSESLLVSGRRRNAVSGAVPAGKTAGGRGTCRGGASGSMSEGPRTSFRRGKP